ncbi:fumarylacetoacetate hydrolase family protein [Bradyrhizobium sp. U87765 SZCCT0131]|uniref:fumarylacetoacetate hydrolase family protein n=1 Tax=unclassified Bradyrhizobium TaxID=2631580 RepID=UPI001BA669F4|nr:MULTISPECIES: fumarylacetoacetate hydrolase family protein [unclassified Bradyrhizobium]MBR1221336.1 fumarylacetoacetate hydrolase family protein [Bradyrhizobium sp. U87765 SZCCT0131]MBR1264741.1 fumarylacetoacetate hydrolase family protein [Bradyrhizobium sp. U87765 SZCCT0134]MBR1304353.1 fumarylacetoacetate hydrolase family protein [Bradyrhizobium sp. U87765 SZCCT0110]MBR1322790.1 fumarylacetoacetate hydrolase family protein [Bradyrhizobium sp. U87765 SZCCT0109]MBR1346282.1 fumarylacetoac
MKLVRHGQPGAEKPGILDRDGQIRDLSSVVPDIAGASLGRATMARLRGVKVETLPVVAAGVRLGACVGHVRNFVAVGLNYADHAAETGAAIPPEPILFNKAPSCIVGPNDDVQIPRGSTKLDWEVELAVVIGDTCSYVEEKDALSYVAGLCVCNDVSERAFQIERGGTWTKGKGCPTFGPLGPWLVTLDEIPDIQNLDMWLDVNGAHMQRGSTRTMIFGVAHLVHYISQFMILEPGDVITTGTPPGVGMGMRPPQYLKAGDRISLGIAGLGDQHQTVVPAPK